MVVFLILLFLVLNISLVRNMQKGFPMEEENLNQKKVAADKEHKECLDNIINTLREEHKKGNLEELLVYLTLESEPGIMRFYTIRTGHTLHQVLELIDEFARERRNQQN
jgi:RNase adaptor protein for sRNA GlmZ degradation